MLTWRTLVWKTAGSHEHHWCRWVCQKAGCSTLQLGAGCVTRYLLSVKRAAASPLFAWVAENTCVFSPEFIQSAKNFEEYRRKWQETEHELIRYKDLLMKTEAERSALDVKLKHARNQVDVEIKRRQKAETDCEKLVSNSFITSYLCRVLETRWWNYIDLLKIRAGTQDYWFYSSLGKRLSIALVWKKVTRCCYLLEQGLCSQ